MCEVSGDGEPCEFEDFSVQRARKARMCQVCELAIQPGEQYKKRVGKHDGNFFAEHYCLRCSEAIDDYADRHEVYFAADEMGARFSECLDEEPESAEWIGKHFKIAGGKIRFDEVNP